MDGPDHEFRSSDGLIRIARFGPVFAGVYHKGLTPESLDAVLQWQSGVMPDEPIISYSLAFAADRLESKVQAAADRLLAEFASRTKASAIVLSAAGFQASTARAMLATLYLVSRVSYPRKVFSTVADAEIWLMTLREDGDPIYASARWLADHERVVVAERQARQA